MIILTIGIICALIGFILLFISKIMPIFQTIYLDWIAGFILYLPFIIVLYFLISEDMYLWVERISKGRHRVAFMRRDNRIIPTTGRRIYASESFFDNPSLGVMEFLGKDCVFNWGKKKIVWALENLNYTPDPKYAGFCHMLDGLGFGYPEDVAAVLNGEDLELMGKVWLNMQIWDDNHGVKKLVRDLKNYSGPTIDFKEQAEKEHELGIRERIDELIGGVGYDKYDKGY